MYVYVYIIIFAVGSADIFTARVTPPKREGMEGRNSPHFVYVNISTIFMQSVLISDYMYD